MQLHSTLAALANGDAVKVDPTAFAGDHPVHDDQAPGNIDLEEYERLVALG